jgi:hypothetical protein
MTSAIDATKPIAGAATTQSVRDNFAAAATEIEALQTALAAIGLKIATGIFDPDFSSNGLTATATPSTFTIGPLPFTPRAAIFFAMAYPLEGANFQSTSITFVGRNAEQGAGIALMLGRPSYISNANAWNIESPDGNDYISAEIEAWGDGTIAITHTAEPDANYSLAWIALA